MSTTVEKPKRAKPIKPQHERIARFLGEGTARFVVELDCSKGTVTVRKAGHTKHKTFTPADLLNGDLVKPQLTLRSSQTIEFRGKLRHILAVIDTATGKITVRPEGITKGKRAVKTYTFADLFTWGPQLQLL